MPVLVGVGVYTVTCGGASDKAGNTGSMSGTLRSIYRWDGFLQPINDTAHQVGHGHQHLQGRQHRAGQVPTEAR